MNKRKIINEHDCTWHKFKEVEELELEINSSKRIQSRFSIAAANKLKIKQKKLDNYLTSPASKKANKWRKLIINGYLKKSLAQKVNFTLLLYDLMKDAADILKEPFPVEEQEVRRFLASRGIKE